MEVVPLKVKEDAERVIEYLTENDIGKDCVTFLQENIVNRPHKSQMAVLNPDIVVEYCYEGRYGSFEEEAKVSLKEYLVVMAINPTLYFYERLGKHSEVKCSASEFDARWATDNDEDMCDWNAMEEGCSGESNAIIEKLEEKASTLIEQYGPFSDESDQYIIGQMESTMQSYYTSIVQESAYPVEVTFQNVYEAGMRNHFTHRLPKTGSVHALTQGFESPQEAAAVLLKRPDVVIKQGEPCGHAYVALRNEELSLRDKAYSYKELTEQTRINQSYGNFPLKRTRSFEDLVQEIRKDTNPRDNVEYCMRVGKAVLKKQKQ